MSFLKIFVGTFFSIVILTVSFFSLKENTVEGKSSLAVEHDSGSGDTGGMDKGSGFAVDHDSCKSEIDGKQGTV